jgi:hypothetical protein
VQRGKRDAPLHAPLELHELDLEIGGRLQFRVFFLEVRELDDLA